MVLKQKLSDFINLYQALQAVSQLPSKVSKFAFAVAKNLAKLESVCDPVLKTAQAREKSILDRYAVKDPESGMVVTNPDGTMTIPKEGLDGYRKDFKEFQEALEAEFTEEVEVNIHVIPYSDDILPEGIKPLHLKYLFLMLDSQDE